MQVDGCLTSYLIFLHGIKMKITETVKNLTAAVPSISLEFQVSDPVNGETTLPM